jgi:hypothetical protein
MVQLSVISLHHVTLRGCLQIARQIHIALSGRNGLSYTKDSPQSGGKCDKIWNILCRFYISLHEMTILLKFTYAWLKRNV